MVEFKYQIFKEDFLTYQLFARSKSEKSKKIRWRRRIEPPVFSIIVSILVGSVTGFVATVFFNALGLGWYFLYPVFENRHFTRDFNSNVKKRYAHRFGETSYIRIDDKFIHTEDIIGKTNIPLSEIAEFNEIQDYFYITLQSGMSFIIPKKRLPNFNEQYEQLLEIAKKNKIEHHIDLEWDWR